MIAARSLARQRRAFHQGKRIFAQRECFDFVQQRCRSFCRGAQALVIPGRGGVCGQKENVRQIVARMRIGGAEIQNRRHEHDAVKIQAVALLQIAAQSGGAGSAVTLADEELWRQPTLIARGVQSNEIAHRFDVFLEFEKVFGLLAGDRATVTGQHRIDEDQIGHIEQRIRVVGQAIGRRREFALVGHRYAARPERAQVQPHGRRPGPPLNENVIGAALVVYVLRVYATKKIDALGFSPSDSPALSPVFSLSSFSTIVPVVTVYVIAWPPS